MKNNLLIVCQSEKLGNKICAVLSEKTGFMVLNIEDYIQYELYNKQEMENLFGTDYYKEKELNLIQKLEDFENCIISVSPKIFLNENYTNIFKNLANTIFIKTTQNYLENEASQEMDAQIQKSLLVRNITIEEIDLLLEKYCSKTILYPLNVFVNEEINQLTTDLLK